MATRRNQRFDKRTLVRLTTWGTSAAVALMVAALITFSNSGAQQAGLEVAGLSQGGRQSVPTAQLASRASDAESEKRRQDDAIRLLAADRDRLLTRVASLERNLDDITGSIKRQAQQPPLPQIPSRRSDTAASLPEIPAADPPMTMAAAMPAATAVSPAPQNVPEWMNKRPEPWPSTSVAFEMAPLPADPPTVMASAPMPQPEPAPTVAPADPEPPPAVSPPAQAAKNEFGVDIGGGATLDEVRALWNMAKARNAALLGNLRPIVSARKDRAGELRLIVGPLPNAAAAAKLCINLGAADVMCSTRPFEGERLAAR